MNLKAFGLVSVIMIIGGVLTISYSPFFGSPSTVEPCQQPLTYQFGDIDPRFDITENKLSRIMNEVEAIWATAMDQPLLKYNKNGKVAIHLIYSEEQKRTEAEKLLTQKIQTKKEQVEVLEEEYKRLKHNFEQKRDDFERSLAKYNKQATAFQERAKKWKGKELSKQTYNKLKQMEKEVKKFESIIDDKKEALESLRRKTNAQSRQLNRLIELQNEMIDQYNKQFGEAKKFNQGRYIRKGDSERINIFQFSNPAQLKTVLAHEAGHAMGLEHVKSNPKSIMFPIMRQQNIFNLSLTNEDVKAMKSRCEK